MKYRALYCMKLISEEYLTSKPDLEAQRRSNLKLEVNCLKKADPNTSISLIEKFEYGNCQVIITDLIVGCDIDTLRQDYRSSFLDEVEARNILKGIVLCLERFRDEERKIVHRDLHHKNIMLHFKELEPSQRDMQDPLEFWRKLDRKVAEATRKLQDASKFQVKVIDYGFAKTLGEDEVTDTPFGVPFTKAP